MEQQIKNGKDFNGIIIKEILNTTNIQSLSDNKTVVVVKKNGA